MPLAAPLEEIDRNVTPLAPMFVLTMLRPVPVDVSIVLTIVVLFWVTFTVPPPVALNPVFAPVSMSNPPLMKAKLIVAPLKNTACPAWC